MMNLYLISLGAIVSILVAVTPACAQSTTESFTCARDIPVAIVNESVFRNRSFVLKYLDSKNPKFPIGIETVRLY
jgi:hypothetical protein